MKKILIGMGILLTVNSAYAINPESVYGRKFINSGLPSCMKRILIEDGLMAAEFAKEYCVCALSDFVSEMSVKDLSLYEKDDPKIEKKVDKIIKKASEKCLDELSK